MGPITAVIMVPIAVIVVAKAGQFGFDYGGSAKQLERRIGQLNADIKSYRRQLS